MPAGWSSRLRGRAASARSDGRRSLRERTGTGPWPATADRRRPAARPRRSRAPTRIASPMNGPMASPRYRPSDARLIASPRRSGGARSLIAANPATKKNASPTPRRARTTMKAGSESTARCATSATTVSPPPRSRFGRRPKRSEAQPTTGRSEQRRDREGADPDPDTECIRPERSVDEPRGDRQDDAAGREEREDRQRTGRRTSAVSRRLGTAVGPVIPVTPGRPRAGGRPRRTGPVGGPRPPRPARPRAAPARAAATARRPDRRGSPGAARRPARDARRTSPPVARRGRAMPVQRGQQLRHAVAGRGRGHEDLRALGSWPIRVGVGPPDRRRQHRPQLGRGPLRAGLVALVDDHEVGDLQQAGLDRLDLVAHLGRLEDDGRVGRGRDLDLALAGPDGLDEDQVEPGRVEHGGCRGRRRGEPAGVPARGHRADEHVAVGRVGLHPDPVAEQRAAGDRRRRIDGHDRHGPTGGADLRDERRDERGLAGARRSGDPDEVRRPASGYSRRSAASASVGAVLDGGQQPGEREPVAADRGRVGEGRRGLGRVPRSRRHLSRGSARVRAQVVGDLARSSCPGRRPPRRRPACSAGDVVVGDDPADRDEHVVHGPARRAAW